MPSGERILVMDDEEIVRQAFSAILTRLGYRVSTANDGEEALRKIFSSLRRKQPYKAIIMDLLVPNGLGGKETIAELRTINATIPVIVTSGNTESPLMVSPKKFGFTEKLPKPFTEEQLHSVLERVLAVKPTGH